MKWMMETRRGLLVLLGIMLSACASDGGLRLPTAQQPMPYPPPGFAHRVASSHVELYWNCAQSEPEKLQLDGVAVNPWSSQAVQYLQFDLVGVDARERTVSAAQGAAQDYQIFTNQSTPFELELRPAGNEVRFDLYYEYRFQDRGHNSFIAGPWPGGPLRLAQQTNRFMVRDVCSDTQHLAR
jgi:hypothetical protein